MVVVLGCSAAPAAGSTLAGAELVVVGASGAVAAVVVVGATVSVVAGGAAGSTCGTSTRTTRGPGGTGFPARPIGYWPARTGFGAASGTRGAPGTSSDWKFAGSGGGALTTAAGRSSSTAA